MNVGKDVDKLGLSNKPGKDVSWCSHFGKKCWQLLKMLNIALPYDQAILLVDIYPIERKDMSTQNLVHECL